MPTRLTGTPSFASLGVQAPQPPNIVAINRAPTVNDFATFNTGDLWINTSSLLGANPTAPTAEDVWMLVSKNKRIANATWINFSGGNALLTLTGNVGGPVPDDPNQNINTVGDNIGITVTGNPATNTLTWSLVGGGVATQTYTTDFGANPVVPDAAGNLNVFGTATAGNVFVNVSTRRGANQNILGVQLNNSIGQPPTNALGTSGVYSLGNVGIVNDRFMHNYGTQNTFLGYQAGNMTLTTANAQNNTFIGYQAGTAVTTANQSTYVGSLAGAANTTALNCTFVGYACGIACNGGGGKNTGTGSTCLNGLTTGTQNCAFGDLSLQVTTGSNNSAFGYNAGSAYVANESGNVTIGSGNTGTAGENNTFRVATAAGLTRAFVQGSYGVNPPGGGVQTVVQDMNGQLGTMAGVGPNPFATTGFMATNSTSPANFFTLGAFVTIGLDTAVFDLGANFNTGTSLYTVPSDGYYWFNAMVTLTAVPNTITECTMSFAPSAGSGTFGPMSFNPNLYQAIIAATGMAFGGSWMTFITAGTTVALQVLLGGSAGNTGYVGGQGRTFFQGYRIF